MLYPKILNIEKGKIIKNILIIVSVIISLILILINLCTGFENKWSLVSIVGIIYVWITTIYSLRRNINIAGHVLMQMLALSLLVFAIDRILNQGGWSIKFAIPIVIIAGNTTLTVLTIASRKKYIRYAIYQLIIFILSMIPLMFMKYTISVLTIVASSIAVFTLVLTLLLCGRAVGKDIIRRFHI